MVKRDAGEAATSERASKKKARNNVTPGGTSILNKADWIRLSSLSCGLNFQPNYQMPYK